MRKTAFLSFVCSIILTSALGPAYVVLDAYDNDPYVKIIPSENKVIGYSTRNSGGERPVVDK